MAVNTGYRLKELEQNVRSEILMCNGLFNFRQSEGIEKALAMWEMPGLYRFHFSCVKHLCLCQIKGVLPFPNLIPFPFPKGFLSLGCCLGLILTLLTLGYFLGFLRFGHISPLWLWWMVMTNSW